MPTPKAPRPKDPVTAKTGARSLVGLAELSADEVRGLLSGTTRMHGVLARGGSRALVGRVIANLFFEDSTRTRTSFSVAAKRLGAEVVDLMGFASSVNKGETLVDTALNVEAMGVDAIVIRAKQSGAADAIARAVRCPIVSGGDGRHEHPTQGLLDTYTLAEAHGRLKGFDLEGLKVLIVGDVASSRVARSAVAGMSKLGASVVCVGPPGLAPGGMESLGCTVSHDLDEHLPGADAVMMLRMQFERHDGGDAKNGERKSSVIASVREYREGYALTAERAARLGAGCIVMHPGPMNRGIEIDGVVADSPRSVILRQVTHGVAVRMAVLAWCLGA
jgi:aspartate carbamoyltransferase catalytic subunit